MELHRLLHRGCEGDPEAEYQLGITYCMKEDVQSAIYWLKRAEKNKNNRAKELLKQICDLYRINP